MPVYTPPAAPMRYPSYASKSSGGGRGRSSSSRARRSSITYSASEYRLLNPVREQVVRIAETHTERRDLFLCHAWDDRAGDALDFFNILMGLDVKVWFSEKDVPLGTPLMRQIDKGLKNSRAGIVLVTPAMLKSLDAEGVADKELSVLLGSGRVIPIAHGTTFDLIRDVSPMLASHRGLTTSDYGSLDAVAVMIADMVLID
ncbi:MAG: toll/interleukin-1 receptor domain-containing protein [Cryobacterium sp.]|nr:toll/interleukin-1 receptor domain-containing protein [Cryobacterium sp.]